MTNVGARSDAPPAGAPTYSALEAQGYRVLGAVARGGMAEILLAERAGAAGIKKTLVLKRLLPEYARDADFVKMFRNEARIAIELQNANIVSVFEFGEADGQLFLAMEYVHGWELARILGACARMERQIPVEIALHIGIEITKALSYAHDKTNAKGDSLKIVHRDVNPANVLVSTDGEVKLADFGIARAAAHAKSTAGVWLKGKIPYMSPEQARAEPIDAQSDLFSLGIVLWEMLAVRRLFRAPNDDRAALLIMVREAKTPPLRSVRPDVPKDVEAIVSRALEADKSRRYATAKDLQAALNVALHGLRPSVSSGDVRAFLASLELPPPLSAATALQGERTELVSAFPQPNDTRVAVSIPAAKPAIQPRGSRWPLVVLGPALVVSFGLSVAVARRLPPPA
ncbi:MAG: serine/threonine protein kinase, partial [Myxococcaceae bacterium]|nr:serine/threonine protein kinase [Myxococcaceae bacterium]